MNTAQQRDPDVEKRFSRSLLDILIRFALVVILAVLCYQIFAPFLALMVWAVILAVTLYPLHSKVARVLGGRQGLAAIVLTVVGIVVIVGPTTLLLASLGDSMHGLFDKISNDTLKVPAPSPQVAEWPMIGKQVYAVWAQAHADLPAFVKSLQPKLGDLPKQALGIVASVGGTALAFLASFIIAAVIMVFGEAGARASVRIFARIVGVERGETFAKLSTSTIRAVAMGVVGVAFIQAIVIGLVLIVAGVPFAGALAMIQLVLGIVQIPALIITLPVIVYIWASGDYGIGAAVTYSILLVIAGTLDNVLKPFMLGRGVDAPMPVILLGALGGLASSGILGMFIGATVLALGYQIFMAWVAANPETALAAGASHAAE